MAKRNRSSNEESSTMYRKKLRTISNSELNQPKKAPCIPKPKSMPTSCAFVSNPRTGMRSCAVLVDSENISHRCIGWILQQLEYMGYNAAIRRSYGDFAGNQSLWRWQTIEEELSFKQIQAHNYVRGKNTSDAAMMIGAMDMLHSNGIECFVLVTSDSDFTPLVKRLKEAGKEVLGFGAKNTPLPLVNEYDRFRYIEFPASTTSNNDHYAFDMSRSRVYNNCLDDQQRSCSVNSTNKLSKGKLIQRLMTVIRQYSDKNGWTNLSAIGPCFPCKKYGYKTVSKYFASNNEHFQLDKERCLVRNRLSDDHKLSCSVHTTNSLSKEQMIQRLVAVIQQQSGRDGWVNLSDVGKHFPCKEHGFKARNYLEANPEHFELDKSRSLVRNRLLHDHQLSCSIDSTNGHGCNRLTDDHQRSCSMSKEQHRVATMIRFQSDRDGWANLSDVRKLFSCIAYGCSEIRRYFEVNSEHFELDKAGNLVRNRLD